MAGPGHGPAPGQHPIHMHPVCPELADSFTKQAFRSRKLEAKQSQVRPLYRFAATGLGASMWFFVSITIIRTLGLTNVLQLMYRAKKDGAALLGWKHPWDH